METVIQYTEHDARATCRVLTTTGEEVSKCSMYANNAGRWHISSWYTNKDCMHQGYGKVALSELSRRFIKTYGTPTSIGYTWNGEHEYVLDWMVKNFHAVCTCPIVLLKNSFEDIWDSHVYELNVTEFLDYIQKCEA